MKRNKAENTVSSKLQIKTSPFKVLKENICINKKPDGSIVVVKKAHKVGDIFELVKNEKNFQTLKEDY